MRRQIHKSVGFLWVVLSLATLMCATAGRPPRPDPRAEDHTSEDAAVLRKVLVESGSVETYFAIVQGTSYALVAPARRERVNWHEIREAALARGGANASRLRSALHDLETRYGNPWSIPPLGDSVHVRVTSADPLVAYKREGTWTNVHPGAVGAIWLSAPGYSTDGSLALVYWSRARTPESNRLLYGDSVITCLEHSSTGWSIRWEAVVHVS